MLYYPCRTGPLVSVTDNGWTGLCAKEFTVYMGIMQTKDVSQISKPNNVPFTLSQIPVHPQASPRPIYTSYSKNLCLHLPLNTNTQHLFHMVRAFLLKSLTLDVFQWELEQASELTMITAFLKSFLSVSFPCGLSSLSSGSRGLSAEGTKISRVILAAIAG